MKSYYYLDSENEPQGPHTLRDLAGLVRQNVITMETMACGEGDTEWRPVKALLAEPNVWAAAWAAFCAIASSPVQGVQSAGANLDDKTAAQVGLIFAAASALCLLLGVNQAVGEAEKGGLTKFLLPVATVTATCLVCFALAITLARKLFRGQGALGKDFFLAGAALLPVAASVLVFGFLGQGNPAVVLTLILALAPLTYLILYGGCRGLSNLPEQPAALSVPIIVVTACWLVKVVAPWLLENLYGQKWPGKFPL